MLPRMKYTHEIIGTHRGALLLEHAPGAKSLVCIDLYTNFIRLLNINYKDWANVTILTCDFTILSSINSLVFFSTCFFLRYGIQLELCVVTWKMKYHQLK